MAILNVRIPDNLAKRLDNLANQTDRTKTYYVRQALEEKLEELEDYHLAMQSLENISTGKSRIWTHKEIEEGHDLED